MSRNKSHHTKQANETLAKNVRALQHWCESRRGRTAVLSIDWIDTKMEYVIELDSTDAELGPVFGRDLDDVLCKAAVRASEIMARDRAFP